MGAKFDDLEGDLSAMRYLDVVGFKARHVDYKDVGIWVFFNIHRSGSHGLGVTHVRASRSVEKLLQVVRHAEQLLHCDQRRIHCHLSNLLPCTENTIIFPEFLLAEYTHFSLIFMVRLQIPEIFAKYI